MKAKNQPIFTSEVEAKDKLIVFVYEYLIHSNARLAADKFIETIGYNRNIEIKEGPGFLLDWWCVFWDLYCAAPERRHLQPKSSSDAQAFHDYLRPTPMSPSITQTSPPQQHQPTPQFISGGPRHHKPPPHPRGPPPPRMQSGPPPPPHQHGGPPGPHGPPGFMPSGNPRYAQHLGPPNVQQHMSQGAPQPPPMNYGPGPDQMGLSPGMNRMTPVGCPPHPQVVGPGGPPMVGIAPNQQLGEPPQPPPGQSPSQIISMPGSCPAPRTGSRGWQGNFNINSPADQQCFMPPAPTSSGQTGQDFGGMMMNNNSGMIEMKSSSSNSTNISVNTSNNNANHNNGPAMSQAQQQQEEYVMPGSYGQQTSEGDSEIRMLKESLESEANESDQAGFNMDFAESQSKW